MTPARRRCSPVLVSRLLLSACVSACTTASWAQQEGSATPSRGLSIVPNGGVTQTFTDNVLLNDADKRSDAVTVVSAGVRLASRGGQVQGFLDYQLNGSVHARESRENETSNALRSALKAELIDNFLYLDGSASISQQLVSAFGVNNPDAQLTSRNRTEVRSLTLEPSLRGQFGSSTAYDVRWAYNRQLSNASELGDQANRSLTATLRSAVAGKLGWAVTASDQRTAYDAGRTTTTDAVKAQLSYSPNPEVKLSGSLGREKSDLVLSRADPTTTWGLGLAWTPSERTRLSLERDKRFFGNAHAITFEHRTPLTSWRFSSTRDLSTGSPVLTRGGTVALYDLLFASLANAIPDPLLRREVVLAELRRQGRDPNEPQAIGFLQSDITYSRRQDFAVAYRGARTTLTLSAARNDNQRLAGTGGRNDDLAVADRVRQSDISLSAAHRLTPTATANLTLSQQRTRGTAAKQSTEMRTISLNWSTRLGPRSDLALGTRHVEFEGSTTPYTENAVFAALGVRF